MTSADFAILDAADPWGEQRADIRAGLQSAFAAAHAGVKGAKIDTYTLRFERRGKRSRAADLKRLERTLAR